MQTYRTLCVFRLLLLALFLSGTAFAQTTNECTGNESWLPLAEGVAGRAITSMQMNGDLYVLYNVGDLNAEKRTYTISRWDGTAWTQATSLEVPGLPSWETYQFQLAGYNGEIYLAGTFPAINDDATLARLAKWNGSAWVSARGSKGFQAITAITLHNGDLYIAALPEPYGTTRWDVMRWNGSDWEVTAGSPAQGSQTSAIHTLLSWNGNLYAGGQNIDFGSGVKTSVMKWDGSAWTPLGSNMYGAATSLAAYDGQLYASSLRLHGSSLTRIVRWNGTAWDDTFPIPEIPNNAQLAAYNNQLYMLSRSDSMRREEPQSSAYIDRFDGTAWHNVSNTNGSIQFITEHDGTLYIGGNFTASCGSPVNNIARLCDASTCGKISGTVFHDLSSDCVQDQDERGLPRRIVEISPGGYLAITDEQGNYSRYVDPGTYTVALRQYGYWNQVCPAPPGTHSAIVSNTTNASGIDFGAQPVANIQDLRVSVVAGRARQGRQLTYAITYENYGTVTMNGTVHFMHDPILTFDSAQAAATRYSPSMAEWDFTGLQPDEIRTIHVWTTVPITTPMETNICSQIRITPENINVASDNDRDSICVPVTGGYDPNDIQVTPYGREGNGVITPRDSVLTYWVRFQNTGNDTAFKVVVVDTLSSHLDIASIRLGAASHPFSFSIDKSNVLVWTFDNIMLPDSNASETNSHGFFKFSVKLKRDLPALTEIANQVHIYFDYNAPVATNTVVSVLNAPMSVQRPAAANALAIYPNPTRDRATIDARMHQGGTVEIRNLLGETMKSYRHDGSEKVSIDLRDLPAGSYLVIAETDQGVQSQQITVVR